METLENFRKQLQKELVKDFGQENVGAFWGNPTAKIVHIGQAPSISGIRNQKPWSDKSGERLRNSWYQIPEEIFYNPDLFYFTALGYYYPGRDKKGGDKKPDLKYARKWLRRELSFLNPRLYVVVGRMAAEFFFPKIPFSELIANNQSLNNSPTFVLPHPSPLNIKWYKDNPWFEKDRIPVIRKKIQSILLP